MAAGDSKPVAPLDLSNESRGKPPERPSTGTTPPQPLTGTLTLSLNLAVSIENGLFGWLGRESSNWPAHSGFFTVVCDQK